MAYLQTTAASIDDILNTISSFATGLGWTIDRNNTFTSGANTRRILTISRAGADYAHFASELSTTKLTLYTMRSTSVSTSVDLLSQTNRSQQGTSNLITAGPYVNFWLFGESGANPYIHCVIEIAAGRYRHFGIGELIKKGTWTGGSYCYGTYWNQSTSYADSIISTEHFTPFEDAAANPALGNGTLRCEEADSTAHGSAGIYAGYLTYDVGKSRAVVCGHRSTASRFNYVRSVLGGQTYAYNVFNQRSNLFHFANFVTVTGGYFRYVGEPPAIRAANITPFQAAEEFTIGSDVWKIFPLARKGIFTNLESSDYIAIAYKKVV